MISKNDIKYYSKLLQKKYRSIEKKFICEGRRLVEEGLKSDFNCELIFVTEQFEASNPNFLDRFTGITVEKINPAVFNKITDTNNSQGIAAVFDIPQMQKLNIFENIVVALDNIKDPGNAGTILRNCDWFGINNVIKSENSAEIFNPKVLRSSMGAVFHLNIFNCNNFVPEISNLKKRGYEIIAADVSGVSLYEFEKKENMVLILSNEAHGPSNEILQIADSKIFVPGKGNAESLNVASASAVILYELTK